MDPMDRLEQAGSPDQAAALAQFSQLLESQKTLAKLTATCFQACIPSPGKSLGSSQQVCLWRCAQRYMETQHFVQKYCEDKLSSGLWDHPASRQG
uniref:Mitochondrial import inner membrane translocase subunit n=1 Tax=Zooxanthella nutricula TaxID=1333877 RepID=A0A6U6MLY4_9DINO